MVIRNISDHLEVVQPTLNNIRTTFLDLQDPSHSLPTLQDPTPALKNCESAISELRAFVDRHGSIRKPASVTLKANHPLAGTPSASSHSPQALPSLAISVSEKSTLQRGWQRLDVARKSNKLRALAARLEQAKSSLQFAQANIVLGLGRYQATSIQEVKLAEEQLLDAQSITGVISAETKAIALGLRADTQASLSRITLQSQTNSAHLTTLEQYASESRNRSRAMADAIVSFSADFTNKINHLPVAMARMVETAVLKAFEAAYCL